MGIREQFQEKAKNLEEKAKTAAPGQQDEASERATRTADQGKDKDKARDTFDENFDG
nr:hypothetical protein OG409_22650 [Streptomyces sp. NBC_00974]